MIKSKQKGHIFGFILPLIILGALFSFLFHLVADFVPAGGPVPYVFVSIFIFPIATIFPLLKELTELLELDSITKTERIRLSSMVCSIQRYLKSSALMLLVFGCLTAIALYFVVVNALNANLALSGIGFFFGSSLYIFIFLFNMRIKIQNYKAKLFSRIEELKQSKKLLQKMRLSHKPPQ